ncbi:MAG TPA: lysozyme inhibitor LprI family protein, partial [Acetobacteraceae bacterium]|nr:lysozyme inhibitor LprI family protein [Acetobacteraceae bacterium]
AQPGPAAPGQAAAAPSFDCAHAGTAPEHTICNDSRLAQLDVAVADAYAGASQTGSPAEQARLLAEQRAWMQTRDACGSDPACLERSMSTRLSELQALAPPAEEAPVRQSNAEPAPEHWAAVSNTALSITGDVTFSSDQITFQNGRSLSLSPVGGILMADGTNRRIEASLFRVTRPQDPVLLAGNTLCGSPITFIAVWHPAPVGSDIDPRALAVFSGQTPPTDGHPGCASFYYDTVK